LTTGPEHRLAVYGTLAPGQPNHHQLYGLTGDWQSGVIRGWRRETGWGAGAAYPGFRPDPEGPELAVQVFTSLDLPDHWARLDTFEGAEYERVIVDVSLGEAVVAANVYAMRLEPG
jgi:gamma-glutamylcyclotransferase (GGCT)/AIG2-like uncharacterized protein YtfP